MALIESIQIPLGTAMPSFKLKDPDAHPFKGNELYGKNGLLVAFTCNHCPYAIAVWPRLIRIARFCEENDIHVVAINPNIHPDYPEDSPQNMQKKIKEWGLRFPYLVDDTQNVAKAFKAQCTPDIYLFNQDKKLIYHGRIDDNWKDEDKVTRQELKQAIECYLANEPVPAEQFPTIGCSIKWQ